MSVVELYWKYYMPMITRVLFAIDSCCFLLLINRVAHSYVLFNWTLLRFGDLTKVCVISKR